MEMKMEIGNASQPSIPDLPCKDEKKKEKTIIINPSRIKSKKGKRKKKKERKKKSKKEKSSPTLNSKPTSPTTSPG